MANPKPRGGAEQCSWRQEWCWWSSLLQAQGCQYSHYVHSLSGVWNACQLAPEIPVCDMGGGLQNLHQDIINVSAGRIPLWILSFQILELAKGEEKENLHLDELEIWIFFFCGFAIHPSIQILLRLFLCFSLFVLKSLSWWWTEMPSR